MKQITTVDYTNLKSFPVKKLTEKDKVLSFMKKPSILCVTAGRFDDVVTNKTVEDKDWCWYRLDGWQWSDRDTYHVEKYDLELDPEFVAYALSH